MLFDVVVILKPTVNESNDGALPTIVCGPKTIIARDQTHAAVEAGLWDEVRDLVPDARSRMEIVIRPF